MARHRHRRIATAAIALFVAMTVAAAAVEPDEILPDPRLEARARSLSAELRCLVCQNQSIDDSNAPLARDLRLLVRERLLAGDSDAAVRAFVVARYGSFVLLRPPLTASTLLLWLTPVLILTIAGGLVVRRRRSVATVAVAAAPLSADEQAALAKVLAPRK